MAAAAVAMRSYARPRFDAPLTLGPAYVDEHAFSEGAEIGDGTVVEAYAYLGAGAVVGRRCYIGSNAHVEGLLGDGVVIGRGALIAVGVSVGDGARVAAGSMVRADVPARAQA